MIITGFYFSINTFDLFYRRKAIVFVKVMTK